MAPAATRLWGDLFFSDPLLLLLWKRKEKKKSQQREIQFTLYLHVHTLSEHSIHPNRSRLINAWPSAEYSCIYPTIASQNHGSEDSIYWVILFKNLTIRNTVRERGTTHPPPHTHTHTQTQNKATDAVCLVQPVVKAVTLQQLSNLLIGELSWLTLPNWCIELFLPQPNWTITFTCSQSKGNWRFCAERRAGRPQRAHYWLHQMQRYGALMWIY